MSIKDLFGRNYLPDKSIKEISVDIESPENLQAQKARQDSFIPQIDYENPYTFAKYGSANLYYNSAIDRILDFYPYDGSDSEITKFYNKSLDIEKYIFDKKYPRTTGYSIISPVNVTSSAKYSGRPAYGGAGYGMPTVAEYITFNGGLNVVNETTNIKKLVPDPTNSKFQYNNIYDNNLYVNSGFPSDYGSGTRLSNLRSDFDTGVTIEFWAMTGALGTSVTDRQVVFDMWNNNATASADESYGRIRIELAADGAYGATESPFLITVQSGTLSASAEQINTSSIGTANLSHSLSDWRHYAFVLENSGSAFKASLYVNGELNDTNVYLSTTMGELSSKNMQGRIGALLTAPAYVSDTTLTASQFVGGGKLSGSLDEFRFWKTARNAEQIGRYWFDQVRGGTNTDISNTTLGMYYKFNEGITGAPTIDSVVLDYAGRLCNGTWTGYSSVSRNTGSAIVSASAAPFEYLDPIIRPQHAGISSLRTELTAKGEHHDTQNAGQFLNLIPAWVVEEAQATNDADGQSNIEQLSHIMGAYFDKLYLQISALPSFRHEQFTSSSYKPLPFAQHLPQSLGLTTPDIFVDSKILERFKDRSNTEMFEGDLNDTKNLIYQNLYNSLATIYKSKGTHRSIRNVLRCFNIDDNLVYFNTYADNQTYELNTNRKQTLKKRKMINFNTASNMEAVVYQAEDPAYPAPVSLGYITGSGKQAIPGPYSGGEAGNQDGYGFTAEASIRFPRFFKIADSMDRNFFTSSLFGGMTVMTGATGTGYAGGTTALTGAQDVANFQVYAIRDALGSKNVRFMLTSSFDPHPFDALTSSNFLSVYANEDWNLSVGLRPTKYGSDIISGSTDFVYDIVFRGYNNTLGTIRNSFEVSASMKAEFGKNFLRSWKRMYVGAQNVNITGSNTHFADTQINGLKYWTKYIDNISLKQHALDRENSGVSGSYRNISGIDPLAATHDVYNLNTLALNWYFGNVTGSDSAGNFYVTDLSSGSLNSAGTSVMEKFGWAGKLSGYLYAGKGHGFPASAEDAVSNNLVNEFKFVDPEIVTSDEMVNILDEDDELFGLFDEVPSYRHLTEKSLYASVTEEILDYFAGVLDFSNMIGDPVHRYRFEYKPIDLLRRIYFEKFNDIKTVEKFTEYFRWFDDAIAAIIQQMVPASAEYVADMYNTVESHILERHKYHSKFPTIEFKQPDPEAPMLGIGANLLGYVTDLFGGVEASPRPVNVHKNYWKKRAQPGAKGVGSFEISSGDAAIDSQRRAFRNISWSKPSLSSSQIVLSKPDGTQYVRNQLLQTQKHGVVNFNQPERNKTIKGGVNFEPGKSFSYVQSSVYPAGPINTADSLFIPENVLYGDIADLTAIEDIEQWEEDGNVSKKRHRYLGVVQGRDYDGGYNYTKTKNSFAFPFNLMSASISGGIDDFISARLSSSITVANLHNDVYGYELEKPLQGPFTEYAVGGHQSRHVPLNTSGSTKTFFSTGLDNYTTRPEAWKLLLGKRGPGCPTGDFLSGAIGLVPADYPWPEANEPDVPPYPMTASQKAVYYRGFTAKRPVNIRNIRMRTGSTILGNFEHNYEVVHSFDTYANPRQFIEKQPALPTQIFQNNSTSSTQTRTFLDLHRTDDSHFEFVDEYSVDYLTGTVNNSIISTRFGTVGGPLTDGTGYRDFRSDSLSVYNTLNNLYMTVIKTSQPPSGTFSEPPGAGTTGIRVFDIHGRDVGLTSHYARHTARFGRDPVALPTIPYTLTSSMYVRSPSVSTYSSSAGLQGWWRLNEDISSAGDAVDSSGNGRDGTPTNRPAFSTTLFPNKFIQTGSCTFDGSDDDTNIGAAATWDAIIGNDTGGGSTEQMTFSAWIYPTSAGENNYGRIIDFGNQDIGFFLGDGAGGTELNFSVKWDSGPAVANWKTTAEIATSIWTHVAVTYDATSTSNAPTIYINGVPAAASQTGTAPAGTYYGIVTQTCHIGNNNGGTRTFAGQISDVAVWNSILPTADVHAIAEVGSIFYADSITATTVPEPGLTYNQLPNFHKIHRNNICVKKQTSCVLNPIYSGSALSNLRSGYWVAAPAATSVGTVLASADTGSADFLTASLRGDGNGAGMTLSMWAKPGAQTTAMALWSIGKCSAASEPFVVVEKTNNNRLTVEVRTRTTSTGHDGTPRLVTVYGVTSALTDANWHHYAVTLQGKNGALGDAQDAESLVALYVDGSPISITSFVTNPSGSILTYDAQKDGDYSFKGFSPAAGGVPNKSGQQIYAFGGESSAAATGPDPFTGSMDQMTMWTRNLSAADISEIYNGGVPCDITASAAYTAAPSNLFAWYALGEYAPNGKQDEVKSSNVGSPLSASNIIWDHSPEPHYNMYPVGRQSTTISTSEFLLSSGAVDGVWPDPIPGCTLSVVGLEEVCTVTEQSQYDNFNIQHQIPRDTRQYAWITSSLESTASWWSCGFTPRDFWFRSGSTYIEPLNFVSASEAGAVNTGAGLTFDPTDYSPADLPQVQRLNLNIHEPVSASSNILGYSATTPITQYINRNAGLIEVLSMDPKDEAYMFNNLMWKRGNQYGYPSWKQVRQQDHPLLMQQQKTNKLNISYLGNVSRSFDLPPVSMKGTPALVNMDYVTSMSGSKHGLTEIQDNVTLKTSYNNEMIGFNEQALDVFQNLNYQSEVTPFEQLVAMKDRYNVDLNWVLYSENLFPSTRREFISSSMTRVGYDNGFWRDVRVDRTVNPATNSVGVKAWSTSYLSESMWALDAPQDFLTRTGPSTIGSTIIGGGPWYAYDIQDPIISNTAGELQNTYTSYHFEDPPAKTTNGGLWQVQIAMRNGGLYSRKHMLNSPLSAVSPSLSGTINRQLLGMDANNMRLERQIMSAPIAGRTGSLATGSGEALWQADTQAGYLTMSNNTTGFVSASSKPWYNDYDDFRADLKTIAKGYAVIPEFRISEQIENYARYDILGADNFDTFTIPGTALSSSQDTFYKDYTNSDFMKNFLDVKQMSDLKAKELRLTCHATIKFNPYKGFYPAQRTLDLVSQFSKSFADGFGATVYQPALATFARVTGSNVIQYGYARPVMQSLFAPGILYNSIKSGMAVDYPIITNGYKVFKQIVTGAYFSPGDFPQNWMIASNGPTGSGDLAKGSAAYTSGTFWDMRVPFEAIMNPLKYIKDVPMVDVEPHPSAALAQSTTASMGGDSVGSLYNMMASNFFAEVGKFFLKDQNYTKLQSNGVSLSTYRFNGRETFGARLRMKTSYEGQRNYSHEVGFDGTNYFFAPDGARAFFKKYNSPATSSVGSPSGIPGISGSYELPQDPERAVGFKHNFSMYSRPSAFGPAVSGRPASGSAAWDFNQLTWFGYQNDFNLSASSFGVKDSLAGYNWSFTPPYTDGEAWVDFIFRPSSSTTYDLQRILTETEIVTRRYDPGSDMFNHKKYKGVYLRTLHRDAPLAATISASANNTGSMSALAPTFMRNYTPYASENINDNAMQIDSCINLFGIENVVREKTDKFGGTLSKDNEAVSQRWIIQPKFETPMLNFTDVGVHPITYGSTVAVPTTWGSGSVIPRGMWHQFGILPESPDHGIFMEIGDIPKQWLQNHYDVVTGSSIYNNYDPDAGPNTYKTVKSFASLMGFTPENSSVRMGEVANKQIIKEAVVAIPYILEGVTQGESDIAGKNAQTRKRFINIPGKRFNAAIRETDGSLEGDSLQTAGASIRRLVDTMPKYILPPQFDFLSNPQVEPLVMYFFEFSYILDQDDLSYIWQNLAPRDYTRMEMKKDATAHALLDTELLNEYNLLTNENMRWMVFKVKQRSQASYDAMTVAQIGEPTRQKDMVPRSKSGYPLSYNWPYDYISIVETIKMNLDIKYDKLEPAKSTLKKRLPKATKIKIANKALSKKIRSKQEVNVSKKQKASPKKVVTRKPPSSKKTTGKVKF